MRVKAVKLKQISVPKEILRCNQTFSGRIRLIVEKDLRYVILQWILISSVIHDMLAYVTDGERPSIKIAVIFNFSTGVRKFRRDTRDTGTLPAHANVMWHILSCTFD